MPRVLEDSEMVLVTDLAPPPQPLTLLDAVVQTMRSGRDFWVGDNWVWWHTDEGKWSAYVNTAFDHSFIKGPGIGKFKIDPMDWIVISGSAVKELARRSS